MKTLVPLMEFRDRLRTRENDFFDEVIPANRMAMDPNTGNIITGNSHFPLQDQALDLLGIKLKVPANYLRRCPPELRARNVNHWLGRLGTREIFIRFDRTEIRAILSTRYTAVSNVELIDFVCAHPSLPGNLMVRHDVTQVRMVAQILSEQSARMRVNDVVKGGINLVNSEVGFASVELSAYLFRVVCTNGMVMNEAYALKRVHLRRRDELHSELSSAISHILENLPQNMDSFQLSMNTRVPNPAPIFERLNKRFLLTKPEAEHVATAWDTEPGDSLFHVINAYTLAANSTSLNQASSLKLQRAGGNILASLEKGQWLPS